MRYLLYLCCFTLVLSLGMAAPAEAKDGKGHGGVPKLAGQQGGQQKTLSKEEQKLLKEQRQLDHELAQAQSLRQIAQRNGNQYLLAEAARMEAQAKEHYAQQLLKRADNGMI